MTQTADLSVPDATKGKNAAIKALRTRFPGSLKARKDAIEMLDSVRLALLKIV